MKSSLTVRQITLAAVVGALYVTMSYFSNIFGLSYGYIQCRFSEALTVLPFLCPTTVWGLFVGCIITNILSPYGTMDLIFGSLATLLAAAASAEQRADHRRHDCFPGDRLEQRISGSVCFQRGYCCSWGGACLLCAGNDSVGSADQSPYPAGSGAGKGVKLPEAALPGSPFWGSCQPPVG